jgi:hypothetical protein
MDDPARTGRPLLKVHELKTHFLTRAAASQPSTA